MTNVFTEHFGFSNKNANAPLPVCGLCGCAGKTVWIKNEKKNGLSKRFVPLFQPQYRQNNTLQELLSEGLCNVRLLT